MLKIIGAAVLLTALASPAAAVQLTRMPASVIGTSSDYETQLAAGSIFDQPSGAITEAVQRSYWLSPYNAPTGAFPTVDLDVMMDTVNLLLFSTHNASYNDRRTGNVTIVAGNVRAEQAFPASGDFRYLSFHPTSVDSGGPPVASNAFRANERRVDTADGGETTMVPEPATWIMLLTGFAMVGFAMRRRTLLIA